ncbi:tetratricopeptide repeat protein [bacterium]|nr:tetratricopeptide repeat protein [bacterium]
MNQGDARLHVLIALCNAYRTQQLQTSEEFGERAVALAEKSQSASLHAAAYAALGWTLEARRRNMRAEKCFNTARDNAENANEKRLIASALRGLGNVALNMSKADDAMRKFKAALQLFEQSGDFAGTARTLMNIGIVHRSRGKYDDALAVYERARDLGHRYHDTSIKARALIELGNIYRRQGEYETALTDLRDGLQMFEDLGDYTGIADTRIMLGSIDLNRGEITPAMDSFQQSLELYRDIGDASAVANALTYIGHLHNIQGRYNEALKIYRRGLALNDSLGNKVQVVGSLLSIGNILFQQSSYTQALQAFQRGLKYSEEVGAKGLQASALIHIGRIEMDLDRYSKALEKFRRSTELFMELGDQGAAAVSRYHIADVYMRQGKNMTALKQYKLALRTLEKDGDRQYLAVTLHRIGKIRLLQGDYTLALTSLNRSLVIREELQERAGIAEVLTDLGIINEKLGRTDSAIALVLRAYTISGDIGEITRQREAAKTLSDIYKKVKDYEKAYKYQSAFITFNDSLMNVQNIKSISEMSAKYESESRDQRIALLEKDKTLQDLQLGRETITRNVSIAGVIVLLLVSGLLFHRYLYRRRASVKLTKTLVQLRQTQAQLIHVEKMVTLGEMTAGLAHEIKNPLNFVTNFSDSAVELIDDLESLPGSDTRMHITGEIREALNKIREHGKRANNIVQGMMLHARTGTGDWVQIDINTLVEEAVRFAYHGMQVNHPEFDVHFERSFHEGPIEAKVVPQDLSRVMLNLLNNAMDAVREAPQFAHIMDRDGDDTRPAEHPHLRERLPTVWVSTAIQGDKILIRVRDNGPGVPEGIKSKIFQPFFSTKESSERTGLGLSISYDIIVAGHGGSIDCNSSDEGTEFVITLPA